jgi:glutaredoxin
MTYRTQAFFGMAPVALLAAMFTALPAHALYKVVGPDGKITYTDRPAVDTANKIKPMATSESVGAANIASLPFELRQAAQRYPVTIYTSADCAPCADGRDLLRQRGIPFSEKTVATADDSTALTRITGSSSLPAVTIGSQVVRGFQRTEWTSYLDAAGYPKASALPANYQQAQATPLTEPRKEAVQAPAARPAAPAPTAPTPPPTAPAGFRF